MTSNLAIELGLLDREPIGDRLTFAQPLLTQYAHGQDGWPEKASAAAAAQPSRTHLAAGQAMDAASAHPARVAFTASLKRIGERTAAA
jgi:hypothetical protein